MAGCAHTHVPPLSARHPGGDGSHIDIMAVNKALMGATGLRVHSIGSGSALDTEVDGLKRATDHKLITTVANLTPVVQRALRPGKRVLDTAKARHSPEVQQEYC